MSKARRRKPKSQRRSQQNRESKKKKNYWWLSNGLISPESTKNKDEPLHVAARENLKPGEFLVRFGWDRFHLKDSDDWAALERTYPSLGESLQTFKRDHSDVQCVSYGGIYVKLKHVRAALCPDKRDESITLEEILRAWGVEHRWDRVHKHLNVNPKNLNRIDVVNTDHQQRFERLWQKWLDQGVCDRIETLYHGTSTNYVAKILTEGFKLPPDRGQAFGPGIYLGPISKAVNYVRAYDLWQTGKWFKWRKEGEKANPKNLKFLIEADVLVGKPFLPKGPMHGSTARASMRQEGCQSVYFGGFVRPEWVVYNPAQVLIRRIVRLDGSNVAA